MSDDPRVASLEEIRSAFPSLAREHAGVPVAYFDGPGGTQVPGAVVEAVSDYLVNHNANRGWAYPSSSETEQIVDGAREALADLLGGRPADISFGPSMTALTFHLSRTPG